MSTGKRYVGGQVLRSPDRQSDREAECGLGLVCECTSVTGQGVRVCPIHLQTFADGTTAPGVVLGAVRAEADPINPPHYRVNGMECVDVIEGLGLGYHLGTALKYLWRCGRKGDRLEDLKKCRWFIDRAISSMEKERRD